MGKYVQAFYKRQLIGWVSVPVVAFSLSGCGNDDKPEAKQITLPKPSKPTAAQCGSALTATTAPELRPTSPGTYEYKTKGKRELIGEKRRVSKLPARTEMITSPARMVDNVWCYVTQRKFEKDLGDTATLLIRGSDIYLQKLSFQSGGYIKKLSPRQPLLMLSGTELDWSGVFRGRTSGRYASEIVGRKSMKVGSRKVKVVGVKSRISYGGDIEGYERSTRWIAVNRNVVVSENVVQQRKFGLDKLRLSYTAHLVSLKPG